MKNLQIKKTLGGPIVMLKVLLGDIVADMRGKSQGMVYQRGRYGLIKRTKVTPVNPQSTNQQTQRGVFSAVSSEWRGLSTAEQNTWRSSGPSFPFNDIFGNPQSLSGNSLFVKLNTVLTNLGIAINSNCPSPVAIPLCLIDTIVGSAGGGTLALTFSPTVPADMQMIVETTGNLSNGIFFFKNKYKIINREPAAATSPQAEGASFIAVYGSLVVGQKISCRIYFASELTGQVGIATTTECIVGA